MRALAVLLCAGAGCGRVAFDEARLDAIDAAAAMAGPCASASAVPDVVTVTGETFTYIDFNNNTMPLGAATIAAIDPDSGASVSTNSDGGGNYTLMIATAGTPQVRALRYDLTNYWTTWVLSDQPYDRNVFGANMARWQVGDGPLWNDGNMGSIYSTLGETVDLTRAMLSVTVRGCGGEAIEGVTFDITPLPATSGYLGSNGLPTATSTSLPYTQLVAFNVAPGPTRIRAMRTGQTFADFTFDVRAGRNVNYVVVHPAD